MDGCGEKETILLIDDDREFISGLKENLEKSGYVVAVAATAKEGIEKFYNLKPSFVTLAISLSDSNGLELLQKIVTVAQQAFTPIAVVSNQDTLENRILSYEIGATDFISKPLYFDLFLPYLKNRLKSKKYIEESSTVDELTGALNRKAMEKILKSFIASFHRYQRIFTVAMIDVDFFKKVNDKYGHLEGDLVLRTLSKIIRREKRESDYFFRYGGEEFLLLMPHTTLEDAKHLVDRIRLAFQRHPFTVGGETFHVTFSAGIASIRSCNGKLDVLLKQVDDALYESKRKGRNCITLAT